MEIRGSIEQTNRKISKRCNVKSSRFPFFKKNCFVWVVPLILFCLFSSAIGQVNLLYQKDGLVLDSRLGYSVAGAGDVNGDGRADFIVGGPYADPGGIFNAGSAFVYSGTTGAALYQISGGVASGYLGWSVSGAGDVNGDGRADFIVGSLSQALVFSGATGALLYQKSAVGGSLGSSVSGVGDINGDGRADFVVGAPGADPAGITDAGSAYIYSGATGALLFQKNGAAAGDNFGNAVAGGGDVDGDGRPDFIVGAQGADPGGLFNAGSAYVYSGATGTLLYQKNGVAAIDLLGNSVALGGDVNGDGRADFLVGARLADGGGVLDAGSAFVYSGASGALLYQKNGVAGGDQLGRSVAGAGDLDGDGRADFIVGAEGADPGGLLNAGSALVYSGATGALLYRKDGTAASDLLGYSVAGAGDVSGDGKADFILGAPLTDVNGMDAGSALVYGLATTDVPGEKGNRPVEFELSQNYPNPFNPTTTIRYYLPRSGKVTLEVFNLVGQRLKVLADGETSAGEHALTWDATDERGRALSSGVYFYRLKGKDFSEAKQMIYLK